MSPSWCSSTAVHLSGEHGDGLVRSPFQEKMYGTVLYQAFRELKAAIDPHNLLNPGKIVDAPPLTANLRYGPSYVTPSVATTFDFSAEGGLLPAAEMCAGVGACRKNARGDDVPFVPGNPRRERQHPRPRQPAPAWRSPASSVSRDSPIPVSTRCSTCASNARHARASARRMWTWPGSRRSFSISSIESMACHGATGSSATWRGWHESGAGWRRCRIG